MKYCQLKKRVAALCLLAFFLAGCGLFGERKSAKASKVDHVKLVKARWYKTSPRFALQSRASRVPIHQFFDPITRFDQEKNSISVVAIAPSGSSFHRQVNLTTGLTYSQGKICEVGDRRGRYDKSLQKLPFTLAIVPRALNELGEPQEVIIFGRDAIFDKYTYGFVHQVKIVGGLLVGKCPYGNCQTKDWQKKLLMVAVAQGEPALSEVNSLPDLFSKINWPESRAWIENAWGSNEFAGEFFPHFAVAKTYNVKETIDYWKTNREIFGLKEQKVLRKSCHQIYDQLWQKFKKDEGHFRKEWLSFLNQNERDLRLCKKFVMPSELNMNRERHWLMVYMMGFLQMHDIGMIYNCKRESWVERDTHSGSFLGAFKGCTMPQLNVAFSSIPTVLKSLSGSFKDHFSFLEYDDSDGGSHQRFYWWVSRPGHFPRCEKNAKSIRSLFPEDIIWKNRNESTFKRTDVIY